MPHHASAKKRMKTNERDRARNKAVKSDMRRQTQNLKSALGSEDAEKALVTAQSSLAKAAKKGVIPKGRAARKISRMAKAVNRAASQK